MFYSNLNHKKSLFYNIQIKILSLQIIRMNMEVQKNISPVMYKTITNPTNYKILYNEKIKPKIN